MVLVRPQFVLASAQEKPLARHELSIGGLQLVSRGAVVWAKKSAWFRNAPYTVGPWAHTGQLEVRAQLAELAKEAARLGAEGIASAVGGKVIQGKRGKLIQLPDGRVLPPVAAFIAAKMKGYRAPSRLTPPYPSQLRRSAYTYERIRAELEARRAGGAARAGASVRVVG